MVVSANRILPIRYYYQYDHDRLPACPYTIHALLHIVEDIRNCGPVWTSWTFVMERYCGILQLSVKSKLHPWGSLTQRCLRVEQLRQLKARYNLWDKLAHYRPLKGAVTQREHVYEPCKLFRLPSNPTRPIDPTILSARIIDVVTCLKADSK